MHCTLSLFIMKYEPTTVLGVENCHTVYIKRTQLILAPLNLWNLLRNMNQT